MEDKIFDETIGKPVPLKEFYNSNPTCMRIAKNFSLRCKKCKSPFVTIGPGIKMSVFEKEPLLFANLRCMKCNNWVKTVYLTLDEKGNWGMANEQDPD